MIFFIRNIAFLLINLILLQSGRGLHLVVFFFVLLGVQIKAAILQTQAPFSLEQGPEFAAQKF